MLALKDSESICYGKKLNRLISLDSTHKLLNHLWKGMDIAWRWRVFRTVFSPVQSNVAGGMHSLQVFSYRSYSIPSLTTWLFQRNEHCNQQGYLTSRTGDRFFNHKHSKFWFLHRFKAEGHCHPIREILPAVKPERPRPRWVQRIGSLGAPVTPATPAPHWIPLRQPRGWKMGYTKWTLPSPTGRNCWLACQGQWQEWSRICHFGSWPLKARLYFSLAAVAFLPTLSILQKMSINS